LLDGAVGRPEGEANDATVGFGVIRNCEGEPSCPSMLVALGRLDQRRPRAPSSLGFGEKKRKSTKEGQLA
jgi:hypothetical protein